MLQRFIRLLWGDAMTSIPIDTSSITDATDTSKQPYLDAFQSVQDELEALAEGGHKFDALWMKAMTTAQRNALTAQTGMFLYNSTTVQFEWYDGTSWGRIGGDSLTFANGTGINLSRVSNVVTPALNLAGLTAKSPILADLIPILDTEASNALKLTAISSVAALLGSAAFKLHSVQNLSADFYITTNGTKSTRFPSGTVFQFTPKTSTAIYIMWTTFSAISLESWQLQAQMGITAYGADSVGTQVTIKTQDSDDGQHPTMYGTKFTGLTPGQQYYVELFGWDASDTFSVTWSIANYMYQVIIG